MDEEKKVIFVTIAEFRKNLKEYLEQVQDGNISICLKNRRRPIVKIEKWRNE